VAFEADYYEKSDFWSHGAVQDPGNLKRLDGTVRLVPEDARNLIDVGCGNGVFARIVKRRLPSIHITCVDRSAAALEHVEADKKMRCEIVRLPFGDRSFDCVSCLEVIEHLTVNDYKRALSELTRIAKTAVIISVPYNEAIEKNVDRCPQCHTVFNRDLHLRSFDDATFADLLSDFGFRMEENSIPVVNIHYLGFRTYYKLKRRIQGVPDQSKLFLSPICPLCGYTPEKQARKCPPEATRSASILMRSGGIKGLIKRRWPKQTTPGYWIVGRFTRSQAHAESAFIPPMRS
jgi:ubiquinone/menaquinone biosynthesis C-methylase UbiE